jgi:hypothetical protein
LVVKGEKLPICCAFRPCHIGLICQQLSWLDVQGIGQLADRAPLRLYPAGLEVQYGGRAHAGPFIRNIRRRRSEFLFGQGLGNVTSPTCACACGLGADKGVIRSHHRLVRAASPPTARPFLRSVEVLGPTHPEPAFGPRTPYFGMRPTPWLSCLVWTGPKRRRDWFSRVCLSGVLEDPRRDAPPGRCRALRARAP